jgi:uncharacterized protein YcbK (DUF882 family)
VTLIGMLVDQGRMKLDEPLGINWLPAASSPQSDPRNAITLRHLLNMSSGLEPLDNEVPGEGYLEDALSEISHLMRDCRTDTVKRVDKELLDVIFVLKQELQLRQAVQVISGYRSPQTNAMLRRTTWGVAKHSMHICGQAADIRMPGKDYQMLYKAALQLGAGGVGRYRHSKFLHVDTGPVRTWG